MSLLSLSNEVLLRNIFSRDNISVTDLQSLMISCRTLYNIIRESDELPGQNFCQLIDNSAN